MRMGNVMFDLNAQAVGREDGESAKEILNKFVQTAPEMVFENSVTVAEEPTAAAPVQPAAPAAPGMGGSGAAQKRQQQQAQAIPAEQGEEALESHSQDPQE